MDSPFSQLHKIPPVRSLSSSFPWPFPFATHLDALLSLYLDKAENWRFQSVSVILFDLCAACSHQKMTKAQQLLILVFVSAIFIWQRTVGQKLRFSSWSEGDFADGLDMALRVSAFARMMTNMVDWDGSRALHLIISPLWNSELM